MFGGAIVKRFFKVQNCDFVDGVFTENYYEEVNYGGYKKVFRLAQDLFDTGLRDIFELKKDRTNIKIEEITEAEYQKILDFFGRYKLAKKLMR